MNVIGLVGSVAAGKSTVAEFLSSLGACWLNADEIAKSCLNDADVIDRLVERWGPEILSSEGVIDRASVAHRVFGSDEASKSELRFLESLTHPPTRQTILKKISEAARKRRECVLLDIPLLFESGWDLACDWIICVDADVEIRRERARKRGWDGGELDRRESNQLAIEKKIRLSQVVMRNETTLQALHENLRRQWPKLCRIEKRPESVAASPSKHCLSDWEASQGS
ncbi:MAG: dephospho-CoA kinase [Planctomycetota bacterium]